MVGADRCRPSSVSVQKVISALNMRTPLTAQLIESARCVILVQLQTTYCTHLRASVQARSKSCRIYINVGSFEFTVMRAPLEFLTATIFSSVLSYYLKSFKILCQENYDATGFWFLSAAYVTTVGCDNNFVKLQPDVNHPYQVESTSESWTVG